MNGRGALFAAVLLIASVNADAQMLTDRYLFLHQGTEVLDKQTELIWRRCATGMDLLQDRCVGDSGAMYLSDLPVRITQWRLPTLAELLSLVVQPSPAGAGGKLYINEAVFPDTPIRPFQATGEFDGTMLYVDFRTGQSGARRPLNYPMLAVRETSAPIWEEISDSKPGR